MTHRDQPLRYIEEVKAYLDKLEKDFSGVSATIKGLSALISNNTKQKVNFMSNYDHDCTPERLIDTARSIISSMIEELSDFITNDTKQKSAFRSNHILECLKYTKMRIPDLKDKINQIQSFLCGFINALDDIRLLFLDKTVVNDNIPLLTRTPIDDTLFSSNKFSMSSDIITFIIKYLTEIKSCLHTLLSDIDKILSAINSIEGRLKEFYGFMNHTSDDEC
jgi:archaellum component FlaC